MDKIKITSFEIENVKRVRAVSMEPNVDGLTVIGGRNGQGKTSVLDAIAYALGGEKYRPSDFQNREGLNPGSINVTLSNGLKVVRSGKNAALKVIDPSGAKAGQKLLDSFIEELALDLPKFMQMNDAQKGKVLLHTLGIEEQLDELDRREKKAYDERTLQNRDADRKQKYADELPEYPDAPDEPLSAADMSARLTEALKENAQHQAMRNNIVNMERQAEVLNEKIRNLRLALEDAEKEKAELTAQLMAANTPIPDDIDTSALQAELENIDAVNAKVRTNMDKAKALDIAREAKELAIIYDHKVREIREERDALLQSVQMPLPGLSVEQGALVYKGEKWDCMSSMEQFRVAVAVCRQLKPECGFVLLDRLEAFDLQQLAEFNVWLKEQGMQAIATRVSEGGECSIIIEDGCVVSEERTLEEEIADVLSKDNEEDNDIGGF